MTFYLIVLNGVPYKLFEDKYLADACSDALYDDSRDNITYVMTLEVE